MRAAQHIPTASFDRRSKDDAEALHLHLRSISTGLHNTPLLPPLAVVGRLNHTIESRLTALTPALLLGPSYRSPKPVVGVICTCGHCLVQCTCTCCTCTCIISISSTFTSADGSAVPMAFGRCPSTPSSRLHPRAVGHPWSLLRGHRPLMRRPFRSRCADAGVPVASSCDHRSHDHRSHDHRSHDHRSHDPGPHRSMHINTHTHTHGFLTSHITPPAPPPDDAALPASHS